MDRKLDNDNHNMDNFVYHRERCDPCKAPSNKENSRRSPWLGLRWAE